MTNRTPYLCLLCVLGSALCWLPILNVPSLDIPGWVSLALVAVISGLSSVLYPKHWVLFALCSVAGTASGLLLGFMLWPIDPLVFDIGITEAACVSVVIAVLASRLPVTRRSFRTLIWGCLVACASLGPLGMALAPPLVARRIARNERLAAERFASLQRAVRRTLAAGASAQLCDGSALKRNSSGVGFSDEAWQRLGSQDVQQDGYYFRVYCWEHGGYTIDGEPVRQGVDGVRRFCTDESGNLGCVLEHKGSGPRCAVCAK